MALNNEQLTAIVNDLRDQVEQAKQENVRRAQEHRSTHESLEALHSKLSRQSGTIGANTVSHEVAKRLDRWATGTTDKTFQGADGPISLREWVQNMKDSAGYCTEVLQKAMEDT